jgi:hypothetical protein
VHKFLPGIPVILFLLPSLLFSQTAAGSEDFFESYAADGVPAVVSVAGELLTRRTYDDSYRLKAVETWQLSGTAETAVLLRTLRYEYEGNAQLAAASVAVDHRTGREISKKFDKYGSVIEQKDSLVETLQGELKKIPERIQRTDYDSENRVTTMTIIRFRYDDAAVLKGQETTCRKFTYDGKGKLPDTDEYKDGILEKRIVYTDESTYVQSLFFDDGYEVRTTFNNGSKIMDRFLKNGEEIRRKTYE